MIWDLYNAVMQHPWWSLYIAILLGVAIHGFRSTDKRPHNRYDD